MAISKAYTRFSIADGMHAGQIKNSFWITFVIFALTLHSSPAFSQEELQYDEISVFLEIPRVGTGEISAVISGEELYLPIIDLFDFLKIKNIPSFELETISGFFINSDASYVISRSNNSIVYMDKTFNLEKGALIKTESNLYLHTKYLGEVFGLDCKFNFRSLSVTLYSKVDLPIIRDMQRNEMRKNLTRLKGEIKADTTIARTHPLFKFGMADWAVTATEEFKGKSEARINLALGAMIAGGEANASLYYNSMKPFNEKDQYYLWRYVNNDFKPLRQVMAGKIATRSTATLYSPVIGVQLTNTPTTYRRSFGSYMLSEKTEPGWIVELYVNNVLVDYVKADASGFFTFQVPLVYGNSLVKLKYYGPWGEERILEKNINIPFTFLPVKTLEYNVNAGFVEDSLKSRFSRTEINYGVSRRLTIGGGFEYLSSLKSSPAMPYFDLSLGITNNLLLSAEYTYGIRAKGTLTYRLPSNVQFDLYYTWYDKNQKAINYNYREERKATLSLPLKVGKFSSFNRFSFYQIILPVSNYTTAEWLFSGSFFGAGTNITTLALFTEGNKPSVYSNISMSIRAPGGLIVMPQAQFSYYNNKFVSAKVRVDKHLLKNAYLNVSYEYIFQTKTNIAELGFRYDFRFAQTGMSVQQFGKKTTFVEYARGSILNDSKTGYVGTDNRSNVGKGGISIVPFIDLNANGKKDPGEPKAPGLNLHTNGGRIENNERDTTIRILGLEPYTSCYIELDPNSFEDVTWRIQKGSINVIVDPNILKTVEIPVIAAGEANGIVTFEKNGETKGLGRIIVNIFTDRQKFVGKSFTEDDGFYSYFGLKPGSYIAMPDTNQLKKLKMFSNPKSLSFNIKGGIEGDFVAGLDFLLMTDSTITPDQQVVPLAQQKPAARKDTTYMIVHEVTQVLQESTEDSFAVQLGAFKKKANADAMRRKLEKVLGRPLEIVVADGFYKVRIPQMKDREEVDATVNILGRNGVTELWVISMKAKQQQWVLTERQDTITNIKEFLPDTAAADLTPYMSIQVGAFRHQANALALRDKFAAQTNKKVVVVREDGLYKVRITGFSSYEEMEKLIPSLGADVWKMPIQLPAGAPVLERRLEIKRDTVGLERPVVVPDTARKEIPVIVPDTTQLVIPVDTARYEVEIAVKVDTAVVEPDRERDVPIEDQQVNITEPTISLHAAVFNKESQAQRAVSKIQSKLNLPAVIVQQWDYYHVVIPGFFTREETYKYYPELAGLGFTEVYIIEKK